MVIDLVMPPSCLLRFDLLSSFISASYPRWVGMLQKVSFMKPLFP
jgi:hypothetical protein